MISFCKMQATGNDFIIINAITEKFRYSYSNLSKFLCNRKYAIGADGVIFIEKSNVAECKMRIFNSDGSEAAVCGNGLRCLAKYLYEEQLINVREFKIETMSGLKSVELIVEGKSVIYIKVDMGNPVFEYNKIPVIFPNVIQKELQNLEINIEDRSYIGYPISMGNPHFVIFVDNLDEIDLEKDGKIIENYKYFPYKTNVEFVQIVNKNKLKMLVWERGVGRTLGCGSGASAVGVISKIKESTNNEIIVELEGGTVKVNYNDETNNVILMGTADKVFKGVIEI